MSLKIISLATLSACSLEGRCETVEQTGPGLTGTMTYTSGDGTTSSATLSGRMHITEATEITFHGSFDDSFGRARTYALHVRDTTIPGVYELGGRDDVCLARQTGGEIVCSPLRGMLELHQFDYDCDRHESGIGSCAETLELTLHARSAWETTIFELDGNMRTVGAWVETECD